MRRLHRKRLQEKVIAIRYLCEPSVSRVVANRRANERMHRKLGVRLVSGDGQFEIRDDAGPSFPQADRPLAEIDGV